MTYCKSCYEGNLPKNGKHWITTQLGTVLIVKCTNEAPQPPVAEAALSQQAEGWVLVPRKPTPEMCRVNGRTIQEVWTAMLSAAPSAPKRAAGLTEEEIDTLKTLLAYPKAALAHWSLRGDADEAACAKKDFDALEAIVTRLTSNGAPK